MKRDTKILTVVIASLVFVSSLACGEFPDLSLPDFNDNNGANLCSGSVGDLTGNWTITASGSRTSCTKSTLNTDQLSVHSRGLPLAHDVDTDELVLEDFGQGDSFSLIAEPVDGICVNFETREAIGDQSMNFVWSGKAETDFRIKGVFTTSGPSGCRGSGTFEMTR